MDALYDLRDMLCKELEEYGKKGDLSAGALDIVDKLTHTIKNLDKIISEGYSGYDGIPARSYRSRYSRTYSRTGDLVDRLRDLMRDAPDDHSKREIQNLISRMS